MKVMWLALIALAAVLVLTGCPDDFILNGVISFDNPPAEAGDCYVFIDDNTDVTDGYLARVIIHYTVPVTSIPFALDTSGIPEGTYYLLGAIDWGVENMDPDNPAVWEYRGWWGGIGSLPPTGANLTNLTGGYGITLFGLN